MNPTAREPIDRQILSQLVKGFELSWLDRAPKHELCHEIE